MSVDLTLIWAGLLAFAVFAYIVMDGFDLGVGILFPTLKAGDQRDKAMNSIAPVWDGNETWLILGGGGLFAAFPLAYAVLMPAVYTPIIAMLLRSLLMQHGHEVVGPFSRMDRARDAVDAQPVDLALLDVQLGADFVFPLALHLRDRGIAFIFLTGHDALALPPELKGAPSLNKPFQADALMKAVGRIG